MSVGLMSVGLMSVGLMSVGHVSVGHVSVGLMSRIRQKYFDIHYATLEDIIKNNTIKNILKYVLESGRFEAPAPQNIQR